MKPVSEILSIKASAEENLLGKEGVTGVGVGYKIKDGKKTDEIAIRVYVAEKKDVPREERIKRSINGVKTDVIEQTFVLHPNFMSVEDLQLKLDTGTYDPLQGGISVGPCRAISVTGADVVCRDVPGPGNYVFVGTIGCIVHDNQTNDPMLLSNFHVMAVDNGWTVGDPMAQPSLVDGGSCPADVVGDLQRAVLGGQVDCAVSSISNRDHICEIVDIGKVAGTATATMGMAVRKRGRTTDLTYGTVDDINLTATVPYCNGIGDVTLTNQIGIDVDTSKSTQFGTGGDSGSVVVDNNRNIVGLYYAGNGPGTFGVANPIQAVLTALDVSICVPVAKTPWKDIKDFKDGHKELKEKPELKELKSEKLEKREWKELKSEKWEKDERKEISPKEWFEDKRWREVPDWPVDRTPPIDRVPPVDRIPPIGRYAGADPVEERLARLEAVIAELAHFISGEMRPDISQGALSRESDLGGADMSATSKKLAKQAADAKQAKDGKDVEKFGEH